MILYTITVLIAVLIVYFNYQNTEIQNTELEVSSPRVPESFEGFKICHLSDVHNTRFGKNNDRLVHTIELASPDIIVISGDLIDSRRTDYKIAMELAKRLVKLAPVYYTSGNHESRKEEYPVFRRALQLVGVHVLDNEYETLERGGRAINIIGLQDPAFERDMSFTSAEIFERFLSGMDFDKNNFTLMLSHRPEEFEYYTSTDTDLVFCGHAHGGQFRVPPIGALYAPHQGVFPKYTQGVYEANGTKEIVSRGLGNSLFPFRFNNRPNVVFVTLHHE